MSDDCFSPNTIRLEGAAASAKLPVLVWILGRGLYTGSTADPQHNLWNCGSKPRYGASHQH